MMMLAALSWASASKLMLLVHPGSTDGDMIGYSSVNSICRRPSLIPKPQPNGAVRRRLVEFLVFNSIYQLKGVPPDAEKVVRPLLVEFLVFHSILVTAICRRSSWTPETQPNGAVRRRLVEFLVFNSIYLKKSVSPLGLLKKVIRLAWEKTLEVSTNRHCDVYW